MLISNSCVMITGKTIASVVLFKVCVAFATSEVCRSSNKVCHQTSASAMLLHEFSEDELENTNIKLEKIKNMRDIGSSAPNILHTGKIFRTDCVSNATENDVSNLFDIDNSY